MRMKSVDSKLTLLDRDVFVDEFVLGHFERVILFKLTRMRFENLCLALLYNTFWDFDAGVRILDGPTFETLTLIIYPQ
jgi:hypothetical protein